MKPTKNLLSQQLERAKAQIERLQETVKVLTDEIVELEAWKKQETHYRQLRVAELDKQTETINSLTAENDKLLRQQLGIDPTTADSLNMEFRHDANS